MVLIWYCSFCVVYYGCSVVPIWYCSFCVVHSVCSMVLYGYCSFCVVYSVCSMVLIWTLFLLCGTFCVFYGPEIEIVPFVWHIVFVLWS